MLQFFISANPVGALVDPFLQAFLSPSGTPPPPPPPPVIVTAAPTSLVESDGARGGYTVPRGWYSGDLYPPPPLRRVQGSLTTTLPFISGAGAGTVANPVTCTGGAVLPLAQTAGHSAVYNQVEACGCAVLPVSRAEARLTVYNPVRGRVAVVVSAPTASGTACVDNLQPIRLAEDAWLVGEEDELGLLVG
jgi:hypothetical protein